jgi:hypothetical protein
MKRWRARAAGLALGVCTALGCGTGNEAPAPGGQERQGPEPGTDLDTAPLPPPRELFSGDPLWTVQERLSGQQDIVDLGAGVSEGFVVLATSRPPNGTGRQSGDRGPLVLNRYASSGRLLWSRDIQTLPQAERETVIETPRLAASSTGHLFFAGTLPGGGQLLLNEDPTPSGTTFLAKLAADGPSLWVRTGVEVHALAADAEGGVVTVSKAGTVTRYDAQGQPRWTWSAPDETLSFSTLAVDAAGNVVLAGQKVLGELQSQGLVLGLSPDGTERWRTVTRELDGRPEFTDLAFRPDGGVFLTGTFVTGFLWGRDMLENPCGATGCTQVAHLLSLDANGQPAWGQTLDAAAVSGPVTAPRVAVAPDGDAAVSWGTSCITNLRRVSPGGGERWHSRSSSSHCAGNNTAWLRDVTFMEDGGLVSAGSFQGTRTFIGAGRLTADDADLFFQRLMP